MCEDDGKATEEEITRARLLYTPFSDASIEVDEEADVSRADDGVWVAAWVWLPHLT